MRSLALLFAFCTTMASAQSATLPYTAAPLAALPYFSPHAVDLPSISQETIASKPFSVIGPRGAVLGQQDGTLEAWIFPWKILSGLRITANMQNYPVPINVNEHAAQIEVQPDATIITYSHANFTVRQIMIAPKRAPANVGAMIFFQIEAVRPMDLTFSFEPKMQRMWPAASDDQPSPEWVPDTEGHSGFYLLHLNFPDHAAALALPGSGPGILAPYQERAHSYPLQFVLHFDPGSDRNTLFPLLMSFADGAQFTSKAAMHDSLTTLNASARDLFEANQTYYRNLLNTHTSIETPDGKLNQAFTWAIAAIDQLKVKTTPDLKEEALTAGFVASGDAARPGFGWFFGRDSLWSLYAINSYGDQETFRSEIEFLLARQSPQGQIMHEWSQTANLVDWKSAAYEYASADSTLLLPMAMDDYLKITGDTAFVAAHWEQLARAWQFQTTHNSPDGLYNNRQGTGWVESWIPSMPHQEIYLAALDEQASTAFAHLAQVTGHADAAKDAEARALRVAPVIEKEYYLPDAHFYAFSHNDDGSTDNTATIFPSVAWWDGSYKLQQPEAMMQRWASSEFSTDWGTRLLSEKTSFYDPISYHQGTVWPLFTGWVSVAEYRAGHPLSGYAHLMQNVNLTWAQDPGTVTELLSGQFYQVLGRSTAHQLWSSAMVISPILRGMFGVEWNAAGKTLTLNPHLPASWTEATIRRLPLANSTVDLTLQRQGAAWMVRASGPGAAAVKLLSTLPGSRASVESLRIPLPPVEVGTVEELPDFGSQTRHLKVVREDRSAHSLDLTIAAPQGSKQTLSFRINGASLHPSIEGAVLQPGMRNGLGTLAVDFPEAHGGITGEPLYVQETITIRW